MLGAIADLIIGIILLILEQAIKLAGRGESSSLTINISYTLICVKDALETGNIFHCNRSGKIGILFRSESGGIVDMADKKQRPQDKWDEKAGTDSKDLQSKQESC